MLPLTGGARHCKCPVGMGVGVGVAIEIELHAGEQRTGVDAPGELVVREGLEQGHRLGAVCVGSLGSSHHRRCECEPASAAAVKPVSPSRLAAFTARSAVSCIAANCVRQNWFTASWVMSATASGES